MRPDQCHCVTNRMTIPMEYQRAADDFEAFLAEAKEALDFTTRNPTYTTVQGVLLAFRRRLTAEQVLAFASLLPPLLRAIFVAGWTPEERVGGFPSGRELAREVQTLRHNHNLSPENSIPIVALVLRHHLDEAAFERVLRAPPAGLESSGMAVRSRAVLSRKHSLPMNGNRSSPCFAACGRAMEC